MHNTPQRSASGEQHSAAGQNRAAEAHAEKGTHGHESGKSDSNKGGSPKDKDNKDGGKRKLKRVRSDSADAGLRPRNRACTTGALAQALRSARKAAGQRRQFSHTGSILG